MSNRIVAVSGSTGGLGRVVVQLFRDRGDTVAGISRSGEYPADLSDPAAAVKVVDRIVQDHGRLDVLVMCTGGFAGGQPVAETDDDVWNRMLDVNFRSALYVCRSTIPHMLSAGRGCIVAVGSRTGVQPAANLGAYGVSKAALNALIQSVAAEVAPHGITANVVLPSVIDTAANREWGTPEQAANWVTPQSIAEVIWWLASDAAKDVNGALVPVYGRA